MTRENRRTLAFTLIELLIVIAIIAILSVVVILTLNPAQIIMQSRDSNRISDMSTLNSALGIYLSQGGLSLGTANTVYVSIPDPTATTTAGDQCQGLGLIALPGSYTYHCAASSTYRNVDGTGWIPVNFSSIATGAPFSQLPTDPLNTSSSRTYYTYNTNGSSYEVTSIMESSKYKLGGSNDVIGGDGGTLATVYEKGSKFGLEPLDYGDTSLVGYWSFEEGSSSVAYDYSGNNATGSWSGTATGTFGYYSAGKIGNYAGAFNGVNNYIAVPNASLNNFSSQFSAAVWANISNSGTYRGLITKTTGGVAAPIDTYVGSGGSTMIYFVGNGTLYQSLTSNSVVFNVWQLWVFVYDGSNMSLYLNGTLVAGPTAVTVPVTNGSSVLRIGDRIDNITPMLGLIDDVHIYNRALSATEIAALYSGSK